SSMVFVNNLSCFNVSFECEPPKASWASLNAPARNRTTEMHENITSRFANKALGSGLVLGRRTSTSAVTHHVSNCRENKPGNHKQITDCRWSKYLRSDRFRHPFGSVQCNSLIPSTALDYGKNPRNNCLIKWLDPSRMVQECPNDLFTTKPSREIACRDDLNFQLAFQHINIYVSDDCPSSCHRASWRKEKIWVVLAKTWGVVNSPQSRYLMSDARLTHCRNGSEFVCAVL
ncbi:uncharacterized protein LACBIDRAFT_336219, partial [Laccaria bicolor S238N-H82]